MCGIVGIIGPQAEAHIRQATDRVAHRGPDDHGYFSYGNLAFGHRRLSILDLSKNGHQPMTSRDGRYTIIFNGEIYNHLTLRKEILPGFRFGSISDTETILYAFAQIGEQIFHKLNGIFALAIFDKLTRNVTLVRDQFGVKPLYYYHRPGSFYFASELKSLIDLPVDRAIDHEALRYYLYYLYSPGAQTPFEHIKKMEAGHIITFHIDAPEKFTCRQYYDIPFSGVYDDMSEVDFTIALDRKLTDAVDRQLLADVPVGFFLSGGLDSSAIVALACKKHPGRKLNTYTIDTGGGFDGFEDDLKYATLVANHLNLNLKVIKTEIDIVSGFDKMIWHLDEPQADAAPLNVLAICEQARANGDLVMLGGTAGDDLFSGYRRHQALNYEALFRSMPRFLWKGANEILEMLPAQASVLRRLKKLLADTHLQQDERLVRYFGWIRYQEVDQLFREECRQSFATSQPYRLFLEAFQNIPEEKSALNRMLYLEMKYFLVDHNLNYTDKMSMAHGVEVRVPFLDLELVNFSTRIPPSLKMKGMETKYLLKKAMEPYLPKDVIYRKKTGFGAPVRRWITKDLAPMIADRLSATQLKKWGIFDEQKIEDLIQRNKEGRIDASYSIWALLAIQSWLEQFADR